MPLVRRTLAGSALALCAAFGAPLGAAMSATVDRTGSGELRVQWQAAPGEAVDVLIQRLGRRPERQPRLVSEGDRDGQHVLAVGSDPYRVLLRDRTGGLSEFRERLLPLVGGRNFRDLGGYPAAEGRQVRWGMLFRSGSMADLTAADYEYLGKLGIRVICDLRATDERQREPTRWTGPAAPRRLQRDYALDLGEFGALLAGGQATADAARRLFTRFYARLPFDFADQYAGMFAELVRGGAPLAFNCSAGKDRTGVAAALVLTALGVPRETVIDDYLLSNRYYATPLASGESDDPQMRMLAALPPEVLRVLMGVERGFVEAAFAAIESEYGTVERYLESRLGVDAGDLQRLRRLYTTKVS